MGPVACWGSSAGPHAGGQRVLERKVGRGEPAEQLGSISSERTNVLGKLVAATIRPPPGCALRGCLF